MQDKSFVETKRAEAAPHKGIVYEADRGMFKATIYVGSKPMHVGRFGTVDLALEAMAEKRKEYPSGKRGRRPRVSPAEKVIARTKARGPVKAKQPRHIFEHADVVAVSLEQTQGALPMLFDDFAKAVWEHLDEIGLTWGGITFESMKRRLTADEPKAQRFSFSPIGPDGEPVAFGDDEKFVVLFEGADPSLADWQDAYERKVKHRRELVFDTAIGCSASDERMPAVRFAELCAARDADKLMTHPVITVRRLANRADCPYRLEGDEVVFA